MKIMCVFNEMVLPVTTRHIINHPEADLFHEMIAGGASSMHCLVDAKQEFS